MPSNLGIIVDIYVGKTHTSRPDYIVDAIHQYMFHISGFETEAMLKVQYKDVSYGAKRTFYLEYMELQTKREREAFNSAQKKSKGKDIDVLLSMPPGLVEEVMGIVNRTQVFKNHQEFIKFAIIYLMVVLATYNTNTLLTTNFLQDPEDLKKLKEELEKLRNNSD